MGEKYFTMCVGIWRMSGAVVEWLRKWKTKILGEKGNRMCVVGGRMSGAMVEWYW